MSEKPLLVCARADSLRVAQGSIFGRRCAVCSAEVMVAPSGQALLERSELDVICGECYLQKPSGRAQLGAPAAQIRDEMRHAKPNPRAKGID